VHILIHNFFLVFYNMWAVLLKKKQTCGPGNLQSWSQNYPKKVFKKLEVTIILCPTSWFPASRPHPESSGTIKDVTCTVSRDQPMEIKVINPNNNLIVAQYKPLT